MRSGSSGIKHTPTNTSYGHGVHLYEMRYTYVHNMNVATFVDMQSISD